MSNNSIQSIQTQSTDSLAGVGNVVGKDGKHSVENAFTTFKDDLTTHSSENALNNLQKLSYRHTTLDTSGVGKFFLSLGQKILDVCHNLRVALDSQQPALNIGVPVENLRFELIKSDNRNAIENEFKQRSDGAAAKYLRTIRQELINLQTEIDGKLKNNNYPDDTKAVLKGTYEYIKEVIIILSPTKKEQMLQFGHELKNDVKDGLQKIGNFVGNLAEDIGNKVEKKLNEVSKNIEQISQLAKKELNNFTKSVNELTKNKE